MLLLKDRVAIVTGASRGIGRAIATTFADHGAKLLIAGASARIHEVAAEFAARDVQAVACQGDVASELHVKEIATLCRRTYGRVDILVNNAGILSLGLLGMTSMDALRRTMDVNVHGVFQLTQYAARLMASSENASIVNLASIAGTKGIDGIAAYSASKAAVVGLTLALAKELAPRIRVNAIAPGFIESDMTRQLSDEWFQKRLDSIRLGRIGQPEDVAKAALYLASSWSSYVTGQVLHVDGGITV